jgi:hypothetical protein
VTRASTSRVLRFATPKDGRYRLQLDLDCKNKADTDKAEKDKKQAEESTAATEVKYAHQILYGENQGGGFRKGKSLNCTHLGRTLLVGRARRHASHCRQVWFPSRNTEWSSHNRTQASF